MYGQSVVCREHSPCYTPGQRRRLDKIPKEEVVPCGIGEGRMKLNFAKLFTLAHMLDVGLYLSRGARSRALWGGQLCAFLLGSVKHMIQHQVRFVRVTRRLDLGLL